MNIKQSTVNYFLKKPNKWERKSFSQSGEDLIVRFIFDNIGIANPTYLDVGAHHPFHLNNTAIFYENGSRGINIEPDPQLFTEFQNLRKSDVNLNCGISDIEGELILNILNVPALNTFSHEEANRLVHENSFEILKKIPVHVDTIGNVLQKYCNNIFPDFLDIDVEGLDDLIVKSIDFTSAKPIVICLETRSYSETGRGQKNNEIIQYLTDKGYMDFADTYLNTIFVLKEKWLKN